ncbi:MAG: (2Fe-2S)-binding protein [Planctomycetota bacterium]|jgi:predicted molibdopterin-dependent oxidoreductase YjgC
MRIEKHPVLDFERGGEVTFTFDGREVRAREGDTIAAALAAAGISAYRRSIKLHRERGFFCGIGRCASCNVVVDGVPDVRACVTAVRAGMDVRTQDGRGRIDGDGHGP